MVFIGILKFDRCGKVFVYIGLSVTCVYDLSGRRERMVA